MEVFDIVSDIMGGAKIDTLMLKLNMVIEYIGL